MTTPEHSRDSRTAEDPPRAGDHGGTAAETGAGESDAAGESSRPRFSRRLGAPIATLKPVGKRPSQVTGLPARGEPAAPATPSTSSRDSDTARAASATQSADMGFLPAPDGGTPAVPAPTSEQQSFYEAVGGHETFSHIVEVFYARVAADPDFRAMYPEADLEPAKQRLLMFLEQYWGGPRTYQERRGHPRLRMRHMPFTIDAAARDTWLRHMRAAVESAELSALHEGILWDYLERAAHSMVNS